MGIGESGNRGKTSDESGNRGKTSGESGNWGKTSGESGKNFREIEESGNQGKTSGKSRNRGIREKLQVNRGIEESGNRGKTSGPSFTKAISKHARQANKAFYDLLPHKIKKLGLPVDLEFELFDHLVLPIMLYGSEVWGFESISELETLHRKFIKKNVTWFEQVHT